MPLDVSCKRIIPHLLSKKPNIRILTERNDGRSDLFGYLVEFRLLSLIGMRRIELKQRFRGICSKDILFNGVKINIDLFQSLNKRKAGASFDFVKGILIES